MRCGDVIIAGALLKSKIYLVSRRFSKRSLLLIVKLLLEFILIVLIARAVIRALLSWMPKKAPPEKRYSTERFEINEKNIVDGEYKDIEPRKSDSL